MLYGIFIKWRLYFFFFVRYCNNQMISMQYFLVIFVIYTNIQILSCYKIFKKKIICKSASNVISFKIESYNCLYLSQHTRPVCVCLSVILICLGKALSQVFKFPIKKLYTSFDEIFRWQKLKVKILFTR